MIGVQSNMVRCDRCGGWRNSGAICPACYAVPNGPLVPASVPGVWTLPPVPKGCICPPGANLECRAPDCPRNPLRGGAA